MPIYLTYMLQQVEYNPGKFVRWVIKVPNLTKVMRRQKLIWTMKAYCLVLIIYVLFSFYVCLTIGYFTVGIANGVVALIATPIMVVLITYLIVLAGWLYYEEPRRRKLIKQASKKFEKFNGTKIAILGSYGKTSMKELLLAVLSESKNAVATPGNKNVPISHAAWAKKLTGKEDFLIIEYGEGAPGDIVKLAELSQPEYAVVTGLAPNHLDEYKTLDAVANDLLSIRRFVKANKLFVNDVSFKNRDLENVSFFNNEKVLGWEIRNVKIGYEGTSFKMQKKKKSIAVNSQLLGRHQIAPLAFAAALGYELGINIKHIEAALAKTSAYEHRMQPRQQAGAWIIDDTYNGSSEGIKAGLELIKELPAKRKIYVTPGLVEQGEETERVHIEIGKQIAKAKVDKTVLMQNSTTKYIVKGLEDAGYKGDLQIEPDPLNFYTNLEHMIAGGDLVLMQNDWTDNYS